MRVLVVMAILIFLLQVSFKAQADVQPVVLRGMSAVPATGSEWIALENTSAATISAQIWSIRDVQGSIKTWSLPALQPYELKMFSGVETKISLNNTGDQVELLQGSTVIQSSAPYEELASGNIWMLLDTSWREVTQEEWERRWPTREWVLSMPSASPSATVLPSPTALPKVTPTPKVVSPLLQVTPGPSPKASVSPPVEAKTTHWEKIALPHMDTLSTQSAVFSTLASVWERTPGDYTEERDSFRAWKRKIWIRLGGVFSCAVFTLTLCAPYLYRCYNEACLFDDV